MSCAPAVRVSSVRAVFHDSCHNAFTDLCRFDGRFYLAFRSCPDGHGVFTSSSIVIMSSVDADTWEIVHRFSVSQRDTRDPHFLVFAGRLFVYTGTWLRVDESSRDINDHLGFGVWSADGRTWTEPQMLEGTYGHYVWRAATCGDRAFLCGRRKRGHEHTATHGDGAQICQSAMLGCDR